ncbi:MAG: RimK family protein [Gammaproteobacteria bacterium]|nr:RimK family protein [Gammaproteobacteria bacterium]
MPAQLLIVVDRLEHWQPFYPSSAVVSLPDYLSGKAVPAKAEAVRVINLCNSSEYLSEGYYCSLLAEARGHKVMPTVPTLNDLRSRGLYLLQLEGIEGVLEKKLNDSPRDKAITVMSYFGTTTFEPLQGLARRLFDRFPCPILRIELNYRKGWQLTKLEPLPLTALADDGQQSEFAAALDYHSKQLWLGPRKRKQYRHAMAILVNPNEELPPSDKPALQRFIKAANKLGIDAELIDKREYGRLGEYDALFIRETTAIDHHTYRFAKKAEAEEMVVIDDSNSILRCCNKVYLHDMFRHNGVPSPTTLIVGSYEDDPAGRIEASLGYPLVLKIPDGSFSRGVSKVSNRKELQKSLKALFTRSALILAQEFVPTEYDWRIGILNGKPIYACRYYMVKDHWQIYKHEADKGKGEPRVRTGGWDTLPTYEVPRVVLDAAVKAARPVGNSLYGIDIKQGGNKAYVIEVNDNPSIDHEVEDAFLGDELYMLIMQDFLRRMEDKGR